MGTKEVEGDTTEEECLESRKVDFQDARSDFHVGRLHDPEPRVGAKKVLVLLFDQDIQIGIFGIIQPLRLDDTHIDSPEINRRTGIQVRGNGSPQPDQIVLLVGGNDRSIVGPLEIIGIIPITHGRLDGVTIDQGINPGGPAEADHRLINPEG